MHPCAVIGRRAKVVSYSVGAPTTLDRYDTTNCRLVYDTPDHPVKQIDDKLATSPFHVTAGEVSGKSV